MPDLRARDRGAGAGRPALAGFLCGLLVAALPVLADLAGDVQRAVSNAKIGTARVGISIVDLKTGRVLAERNAGDQFIPASNMKVLTSGAALLVLGPDFVFRTEVRLDGDRLVVVGSGDPALADPGLLGRSGAAGSVEELLGRVVGAVASVPSISEVVMDDRVFDTQFVHPSWPRDQLNRWYCAEVSGINFHANTLSVFPRPSPAGPGHSPEVAFEPRADWITVATGRARTVASGNTQVSLTRDAAANTFELFGQVRNAVRQPVEVTVHDNPIFFGQVIADRLARGGIAVAGSLRPADAVKSVRRPGAEERFDGGAVAAVIVTPLAQVLSRCNTDSHNLYAEALLKRIGHEVTREPGSWANGASVVRMTVAELIGPDRAAAAVISDGSGMSRENRVTPRMLTAWLDAMQRHPRVAEAFIGSLAEPGTGPLRNRFLDRAPKADLQAKTGYINGVRALSGYLTHPRTGRRVAFSILLNDLRGEGDAAAKRLQEQIVLAIDAWLLREEGAVQEAALGG